MSDDYRRNKGKEDPIQPSRRDAMLNHDLMLAISVALRAALADFCSCFR